MSFFSQIEGPTKAVLDQIFADPDLAKEITYRRFKSQQFDPAVKANVTLTDDIKLTVVRLSHTTASQLVGQGPIQVGDELYLINGPDVPEGMSMKDDIVDENGQEQTIKSINDIFGLATSVTIDSGGE